MCGIAGVVGLGDDLRATDRVTVRRMTRLLRHRGPDSSGYHDGRRVSLGNTRLSILDLSDAGALPMPTADGKVWIAYNGEVTNFKELQREHGLRQKYPFRSTSDTEVLLYLYEELGIDFVKKLTGQFAFVLYDSRVGKVWIVRDFFGIRPMFFMKTPDRLYFGSEIKALTTAPEFDTSVDTEGLYHFFSLAYIPGRHTPFECVEELLGGELIEIDLATGKLDQREYYQLSYPTDYSLREKDLTEALYWEMRDSVRRNLISDAPLGLTLSGGFDTSSILALSRQVVGPDAPLHTFSIRMKEDSYDESHYQRLMARYSNTIHHEIPVGPQDVADNLVEHMAYMDEPSGDGAAIPSYIMAKVASEHVKVLLSGEGGDETFNAYETHVAWKARRLYRQMVPKPLRLMAKAAAHALPCNYEKLSFDFVAKRFTTGTEMPTAAAHLYWRHCLDEADKRRLMPKLAGSGQSGGIRPTWQLFQDDFDKMPYPEELDRISVLDLKYYFIGDLMVKNDRTIMASSIETRFPYMDRILLEFVQRIRPSLRIKGFHRRHMQKEAMRPHLPREIYDRSNFGLEMPHSLWFLDSMRDIAESYFDKAAIDRAGIVDGAEVQRLWTEHVDRKRDHGRALWCVLNLQLWHQLFVQSRDFEHHLPLARPLAQEELHLAASDSAVSSA